MNLDSFNSPYWFELAVVFGLSWLGNILLSAFSEQETRWRRIVKTLIGAALALVVSATAGREWFFVMVGVFFVAFAVIHAWWLPKQGVNGWTAEPRERYHALRGWKTKA